MPELSWLFSIVLYTLHSRYLYPRKSYHRKFSRSRSRSPKRFSLSLPLSSPTHVFRILYSVPANWFHIFLCSQVTQSLSLTSQETLDSQEHFPLTNSSPMNYVYLHCSHCVSSRCVIMHGFSHDCLGRINDFSINYNCDENFKI